MKKIFVLQHLGDKSVQNIMHEQSVIKNACEKYFENSDNGFVYSVEKGSSGLHSLSNVVDVLINTDMLVLGDGWQRGKEGRVLYVAAQLYGIPVYSINRDGNLSRVQHEVIVKLKDKDPIFWVSTLHLDVDGSYVIHADSNFETDEVTRFSDSDVELIIM